MEDLLSVSIADLKRVGLLKPNTIQTGAIYWTYPDGTHCGAMGIVTDTTFEIASVRFVYEEPNGKVHDERVLLRWKRSNLNDKQGFYYFGCPVSGRSCHNLYLVGGRWISRYAFRALYRSQNPSGGKKYPRATISEFKEIKPTPPPTPAEIAAKRQREQNEDLAAAFTWIQNGGGAPTSKETPK